jgi:hypothetical protein
VLFAAVTRNERPTASSSGSTAPTTGVVNAAAPAERERRDFTDVQIGTLLSEYKDNEVRADSQFKGKYFRVSGVVDAVAKDMMNSMYVTVGTGAAFELPKVQCMLRSDQATMASKLSKGSRTSVMGKVEGKMMNVLLRDCELQ